jgi:hypothetical protein
MNCLLKHVIKGEMAGNVKWKIRQGRRRNQLPDDLTEKRIYWNLKEEAPDRTLWRTHFIRSYGPPVRQATHLMKK